MPESLKILFVASEAVPFAKTGGLADVAGSLPKALFSLGHDVRLAIPKYGAIEDKTWNMRDRGELACGGTLKTCLLPGTSITVMFTDNEKYFGRWGFYGENGADYPDNAERFLYFNNAVLSACEKLEWIPDVIHCNDWQSSLIPLFLKLRRFPVLETCATIVTIHNIAYQGYFENSFMEKAEIPWELYTPEKLEYWNGFSFLKAGLIYGDLITTVSEKYAAEILESGEYGRGMEGVLRAREQDLHGIINGIDYDQWNPLTDKYLVKNYNLETIERKQANKRQVVLDLKLESGENTPLISMVSRLDEQKGLDILIEAMDGLMKLDINLVLLGIGDRKFYPALEALCEKYKGRLSVNLRFDNPLGHLLYGGSDMFLMPSHFEPCGLSQLISFKYGVIPVARSTGGLYDTVANFNPRTGKGNGFTFGAYSPAALLESVTRAVSTYADKKAWSHLIRTAMTADFSWEKSARKYSDLYELAVRFPRERVV